MCRQLDILKNQSTNIVDYTDPFLSFDYNQYGKIISCRSVHTEAIIFCS